MARRRSAAPVTLRPGFVTRLGRMQTQVLMIPLLACGGALLSSRMSWPWTLMTGLAAAVAGALVGRAWLRPRVELRTGGVTLLSTFRIGEIPWDDIDALFVSWTFTWGYRRGYEVGYTFGVQLVPGSTARPVPVPLLADNALIAVGAFLREHHVPVLLNPVEPWRDRSGTWHGPGQGEDPLEAIASMRRAYVGPWIVRVRSVDGGFEAVTETVGDHTVVREAPIRPNLTEAIADGTVQVRQAMADLTG